MKASELIVKCLLKVMAGRAVLNDEAPDVAN